MDEETKEKGFVVKDRRLFDQSGESRGEEAKQRAEGQPAAPRTEPRGSEPEQSGPGDGQEPLPEVNFASFILSLSTTAMYHFGDFPDPVTQEGRRNLPAAKQTIDILSLLHTKTTGNLSDDERQLLEGILFELRMRFVKEMSAK